MEIQNHMICDVFVFIGMDQQYMIPENAISSTEAGISEFQCGENRYFLKNLMSIRL